MKNRNPGTICKAVSLVMSLLATQSALAAGFYISEVGTPLSVGTAGVANPTNTIGADSVWTNPAGMTGLNQSSMLGGFQVVAPNIRFDSSSATTASGTKVSGNDGGNAGNALPIPSFFYVNRVTDRLRLGISSAGIMGGGVDYGDRFVGRYAASLAELGAVGISPAIGFKVNDKFSVGAGVSIVYTRFDMDVAIKQSTEDAPDTPDGKLKIVKADDWGYQPYAGLTYHLTERAMLGLVYRAEMDVNLEGDLKFHDWKLPIPKPKANDIDVDWDNPQTVKLGLKYRLDDKNLLFLSAGWEDWSKFSENTLALKGGTLNPEIRLDREFDDTWNAGIALAHYEGGHGTTIGFAYESSPVSDRHRTLDLPFEELYKISFAYAWVGHKDLDFSLGSTIYLIGDAKIDQTSQGVRTKGKYDTNYIVFLGGTVRYRF